MSVTGIWHIGFTVSDLDRAVRFYRDGLGLQLRHQQVQANEYTARLVGYEGIDLKMAQFSLAGGGDPSSGHIIELSEYRHPQDGVNPPGTSRVNSAHIALQVDDIATACKRIEEAGGTLISEPQEIMEGINKGGKAVYARDPDGISIELVVPPSRPGTPQPEATS